MIEKQRSRESIEDIVEESGVKNIQDLVDAITIVKEGLVLVPNNDFTVSLGSGSLISRDALDNEIDSDFIAAQTPLTFDIMLSDGTIDTAATTTIDFTRTDNGDGTTTVLPANNDAAFPELFINKAGNAVMLLGQQFYASIGIARQTYFSERKVIPAALNGYIKVGGFVGRKDASNLQATNVYPVYTSKFGEINIGGGESLSTELLKTPVADLTALKALVNPLDGEVRQITSELPSVVFYTFNTAATTGETADDGTTGFWNILEGSVVSTSEDRDVVLIYEDGTDNTLYPFSTGETWADIKANYEQLRFDITTSDAGQPLVVPHTVYFTPADFELFQSNAGRHIVSANGVEINVNTVVDADTGFTYQQSSGDTASGGRMRFRVTGVKAQKTVVDPALVPVEDQSALGYFDTGNKRQQWGRVANSPGGIAQVNFPVPMANTGYGISIVAGNGSHVEMTYINDTTTGFQAVVRDTAGGAVDTSFAWSIVGLKP